jgi:hypothetical protein
MKIMDPKVKFRPLLSKRKETTELILGKQQEDCG